MDIEDVKKVIKSLTNKPCICGDNAIIVSGGYVILKKEEHERLTECCKKQIPKVHDFEGDGYSEGELVLDTWICPGCGEYYEVDYDHYDFCPKCGQAIDWSDE